MTQWSQYANAPMATEIQNELYPVLRKELAGLSEYECVCRILNWVQTGFAYEYDEKVWGMTELSLQKKPCSILIVTVRTEVFFSQD